jgi:hypothetical protein
MGGPDDAGGRHPIWIGKWLEIELSAIRPQQRDFDQAEFNVVDVKLTLRVDATLQGVLNDERHDVIAG